MSFLLVVVTGLMVGCGTHPPVNMTTAAPPWRVCGHTLYAAPAGPVVIDASRSASARPITHISVGQALYLRLSRRCSDGVRLTFVPRASASISKAAVGKHGLVAAIVKPHRARFDIRIVHGHGATQLLRVRLH